MAKNSKSFFERLTGNAADEAETTEEEATIVKNYKNPKGETQEWLEDDEEGQLTVDMYQTPNEIIIQAMVAGVKSDELDISISQDMITVKGQRQRIREFKEDEYYYKELYWGSFSRSILLPQEIDSERADASVKNGLLTIRLPKINKDKVQKVKIKGE
jgi:HSP20 family protein